MPIEAVSLSPKKNGKGYISSYSVNISNSEARECNMIGKRIIKIVDPNSGEIIIKAKEFSLTIEILREIVKLKNLEREESELRCDDNRGISIQRAFEMFKDEQLGAIGKTAHRRLEEYLFSLSAENILDLALLMYLGRDMDCDMDTNPGEERFINFYDRYGDIVNGMSKEGLIYMILEKVPLVMYLRSGYRLLTAQKGTSIDSFLNNWNDM